MKKLLKQACVTALGALPFLTASAQKNAVTWLEMEDGDGWDAIPGVNRWEDAEVYSGGKAMQFEFAAGKAAEEAFGEEGKTVAWAFPVAAAGEYDVWMRVGYEFHRRADFDWRLDDGEWRTLSKNDFGDDLRQTAVHGDIDLSWVRPATALKLAKGDHVVELRFTAQAKAGGKPDKDVFLGDAIVFAPPGSFVPYGKFAPDEDHQTDADRTAAAHVFTAREDTRPPAIMLNGQWELARVDEWEGVDEADRLQPMAVLPEHFDSLRWTAINVPHNNLEDIRLDLRLAHRVLFRARVFVPASWEGRSFQLDVPNFSMVIGAFVNGQYLGGTKNFLAPWSVDATAAVRPGEVNEIIFSLKTKRYSLVRGNDDFMNVNWARAGVRPWFSSPPWSFNWAGPSMDVPMSARPWTGLLETPSLVARGPVYTADVFVKTWVSQRGMAVEYEVHNPLDESVEVAIGGEIRPWTRETPVGQYGALETEPALSMPVRKLVVMPGQTLKTEVRAPFTVEGVPGGGGAAVKLWWPSDPRLYVLTTFVESPFGVDAHDTRFGFREWGWRGDLFTLNGVPWQFWADDTGKQGNLQSLDQAERKSGMNIIRLWGYFNRRQAMANADESGMVVRSSMGMEGMGCNYWHGLTRSAWDATGKEFRTAFRPLFDNWIEQIQAQVKSERNHPSVLIWSVENEIVYINANNLGMAAQAEPEIRRGAQAVEVLDPTRPTMVDGGRALRDQSMPVNGAHYDDYAGRTRRDLPDGFYDNSVTYTEAGKQHGNWIMAKGKPVFHGEAFFANGWKPSELSMFGGDAAALGRAAAFPARGLYAKMLSEGYRWDGVAAWHMWLEAATPSYWVSWQPVAALCREWDRTFAAGKNFPRTLRLFNQTQFGTPITVRWAIHKPGAEPAVWGERAYTLAPGGRSDPFTVQIAAGHLEGDEIAAGRGARVFTVRCVRDGEEVFREDKDVWILNPDAAAKPRFNTSLYVWDAHGAAKKRLEARGVAFEEVSGLKEVPEGGKLLVGADTVSREEASSSAWQRFALAGGRVVMLDQANPLRHQALPVEAEPTAFVGRIAFLENPGHPVFAGLNDDDFFCRSKDHITYRNVWRKSSSLKSLAQCDEELNFSAYFEAPTGDGLLALCQFAVGDKLDAADPVMTRLFDNLVNRLADYTPVRKEVRSLLGADTPAGRALARTGAWATQHAGLDAAVPAPEQAGNVLLAAPMSVVAGASAAQLEKLRAFMEAGGWLVINDLAPENLAAFNALVGVENLLRPMAMERVQFAPRRDWVAAGLSTGDLVMDTGKKIFNWMELREPVSDMFSQVVDAANDLAPFSPGPFSPHHNDEHVAKHPDGNSRNMVNGFTGDDTWMWIWQTGTGEGAVWIAKWEKPYPLASVEIAPNHGYQRMKAVELRFDDDPEPMRLELANDKSPQTFDLGGRTAQKLTFRAVEYHTLEQFRGQLTGVDTMRIFAARGDDWQARVLPVDNIGGIVRYDIGRAGSPLPAGGVLLVNLLFQDEETNPVNRGKKDTILKTLLSNLGAVFAEGGRPTAGWRLDYRPIPIAQQHFNLCLTQDLAPAWFMQPNKDDLSRMPAGEQMFADIRFATMDFRTSPVAGAVSLHGNNGRLPADVTEATGIEVGGKADCLYFLHTWNASNDIWNRRDHAGDPRPWPMFTYRVNYADGESVEVPVAWQRDIGHWQAESPVSYANAALAWVGPAPEGSNLRPVVYAMQWDNPSPEKEIASVDLLRAANGRWGAPALLAITAATKAAP
ncbi:MAG: hypothetical protein FWF96_00075 [Kiritimatiellaeota bacterium]|nr:hypothetical protein [Kiritimatiellota bacterium]